MAAIDIGGGATDMSSGFNSQNPVPSTIFDNSNAANDTGTLTSFEIFAVSGSDLSGCIIGTVGGSGTSYTVRDYESIGAVTSGSKQTFTGKDCDVSSGDYLAVYFATGIIEGGYSAGPSWYVYQGNAFSGGAKTYTATANRAVSVYATGSTGEAGWSHITKVDGVTASGAAKKDGIAVGSVAKINGVAV